MKKKSGKDGDTWKSTTVRVDNLEEAKALRVADSAFEIAEDSHLQEDMKKARKLINALLDFPEKMI